MPRISTHFSLARLLREHSHHDTPPRSLQGHPHHDHGEQKADDTSGRESPDLNPRLGEEATPLRLNAGPPHSQGGLYGGARIEGGRISATGGKFWAKIRILWGIASGASGLSPPQAENFFGNDAFKEKIY